METDSGSKHNRDDELAKILELEQAWESFSSEEKRTWYEQKK